MGSFLADLKHRNVFKLVTVYVIAAFLKQPAAPLAKIHQRTDSEQNIREFL